MQTWEDANGESSSKRGRVVWKTGGNDDRAVRRQTRTESFSSPQSSSGTRLTSENGTPTPDGETRSWQAEGRPWSARCRPAGDTRVRENAAGIPLATYRSIFRTRPKNCACTSSYRLSLFVRASNAEALLHTAHRSFKSSLRHVVQKPRLPAKISALATMTSQSTTSPVPGRNSGATHFNEQVNFFLKLWQCGNAMYCDTTYSWNVNICGPSYRVRWSSEGKRLRVKHLTVVPVAVLPEELVLSYNTMFTDMRRTYPDMGLICICITASGVHGQGEDPRFKMHMNAVAPELAPPDLNLLVRMAKRYSVTVGGQASINPPVHIRVEKSLAWIETEGVLCAGWSFGVVVHDEPVLDEVTPERAVLDPVGWIDGAAERKSSTQTNENGVSPPGGNEDARWPRSQVYDGGAELGGREEGARMSTVREEEV
ncbi:hypothetical protein B0H16DRAFT_1449819 [Mycena metata]|uniref:Uncharacterized protein n=1 Tax=Mycena metata TaxID=1033252 RepID=A0AAD7K3I4_9AGAR|nr:hypothetical protein B0H16DRAFT_1449819 [Mycena metata]